MAPPPAAAPRPAPTVPDAEKPEEPVVSFVRGVATARPARGGAAFNAAPTIPVGAINAASLGHANRTPEAPPASQEVTPPPPVSEAHPEPIAAAPVAPSDPVPSPAERPHDRRASAEFDALESDFFARESELYKKEALESFEDLDPGKKNGGRNGRGN
jgi:hypothetical protein